MRVNKQQITNGVLDYIKNDVIKNVPDQNLKVAIGSLVFLLRNNPAMFDNYIFNNPKFSVFLQKDDDDKYDIDVFVKSLSSSVREFGNIKVEIPSIPLILKEGSTLGFSSSDIDRLLEHIERACA